MHRLTQYLGEFVAYRRLWAWTVVVAVTVASTLGWAGYRLRERKRSHEPPMAEWAALFKAHEAFQWIDFPCVLVLESEDFFQPQRIAVLGDLVSGLEQTPYYDATVAKSVLWIGKIPKIEGFRMTSVLPPPNAPAEAYEAARQEITRHPLVADQLLSSDGKTMLMPVLFARHRVAVDEVERIAKEACANSGIRVRVTGLRPLHRSGRAFDEDHDRIVATACIMIFVLAMIIFRGPSAMLIVSSGPMLGNVWALGLLKLFRVPYYGMAEVILPVMILMIGLTDGVHLVIHIRRSRAEGMDPRQAARSAVRHVGVGCALTSLTTAVAFASLTISDSKEVSRFGFSSAIGVLITFWAVVLVVPLLSSTWLGRRIHLGHQRDLVGGAMRSLSRLPDAVVARARWVAVAGVMLTALLAGTALTLKPDSRLAHVFPHATEAYQALVHCDRELGGIHFVQVLVQWPEDADYQEIWQALEATENLLGDEPLIRGPLSVRQFLSLIPGAEFPGKLSLAGLIPQEYRRHFWQPDAQRALVVARMQDLGIARYDPTIESVNAGLRGIEGRHPGFQLELSGWLIAASREQQRIVRELAWSLTLAAAMIFVVVLLAYRSLRIGLMSTVPNLFPLAATAALLAIRDTSLDIGTASSFVICLGIAVDDTIHFLTRFQHERQSGADVATSIRNTFVTVGSALVMTTVVMIAGFLTVLTSRLPTHQAFAAMGCITLGAALFGDLIILPALLACFPGRSEKCPRAQSSPGGPDDG